MRLVVLGLQGSGKTYLVKTKVIPNYGDEYLVFDPNREYTGFNRYTPKFTGDDRRIKEELGLFIRKIILPNTQSLEDLEKGKKPKKKRLKLVVFDEADLIAPSKTNIPAPLRDLVVRSRHLQLDIIFISRRPTDLNAYLMDTSDYMIVFKQVGYNALKTMRALKIDSDAEIKDLVYEQHEFLLFDRERSYQRHTAETLPENPFP
ncbi:hypothetical protein KO465_04380 [Candidatus Micrarchaeota archaeon]|jgi:hypothetical protein|nr:hypothetical protein [Candidatus Micrarchaeota archaeon]